MPFSSVRRHYFDLGARALDRVSARHRPGLYACPVCARTYPPECLAMNPWVLCLLFAPPQERDPGRMPVGLVCASCFGSSAADDRLVRPFLDAARVLPDLGPLALDASNSPIADAPFFLSRFVSDLRDTVVSVEPSPDPLPDMLLWSAFAAAFAAFGYRYVFSDGGSQLRQRIRSLDGVASCEGYFRSTKTLSNRWMIGAGTLESCWFPVVVLDADVVVLPPMRLDGAAFYSRIGEHVARCGGIEVRRLGWPGRPNHYLDE